MKKTRVTRWLIAIAVASLFYIPLIEPVTHGLGAKAVITQIVFGTIRLVGAVLIILIFRAMIWFVRRSSSKPLETLDLPADAFQVRLNLVRLHIVGLVITGAVTCLAIAAYHTLWGNLGAMSVSVAIYIVLLLVLHELSHALGWIIRGIPIRSIKFGVMWRILAPYAHCRVPMSMSVYRFALMLPLFTTGLLPFILGLYSQNVDLTAASVLLIGGACGDLSMLLAGIAFHPQSLVMDHPSEPAFIILKKGNLPGPAGQITVS